jgi:chaperonin GroES
MIETDVATASIEVDPRTTHRSPQVRPLGNRLLIHVDKPASRTESGLYIPDSAQQTASSRRGRVLTAGPGSWNEHTCCLNPMRVKQGDAVLFGQYAGCEVDGDKHLLIVCEAEILAVIE